MRAVIIRQGGIHGEILGYALNFAVAEESLRISFSAWPEAKFTRTITGLEVGRPGFDKLTFTFEPIDVHTAPTHL